MRIFGRSRTAVSVILCRSMLEGEKLSLPEQEERMLKFWRESKVFERSFERMRGRKAFRFYEGPPTANGRPGIHHVLARAFKDVICRYKTMRGFYVERKAGWDTHGLPVEIEVEKELGLKTKKDIEQYGIAEFNRKCKESVWRYKDEWEKLTERIGFWLDLKNPYITYQAPYIETLWWIIKQFWQKKLLYKGHKVVPWCTRCGTALSSHEMALGYKETVDRSVYVKFRVKHEYFDSAQDKKEWKSTSILSWTTTPWTLPGNVALAINPGHTFVCVPDPQIKNHWIVLELESFKRLLTSGVFPKGYESQFSAPPSAWRKGESGNYDVFDGRRLLGIEYEQLFKVKELQSKNSFKVYAADFVGTGEGTGVVHTAVMYGEDDYQLGARVGLPKVHTVDEGGRFVSSAPVVAGLYVKAKETDEKIIRYLDERKFLFAEEQYRHEYPHCWRCDTPLLYYARDSWFVAVSKLRKKLKENNKQINWIPSHIKEGRFGEWLKEAKDWNFSRERYWGTPLPIWECTGCRNLEVIGSREELTQRTGLAKNRYFAMRHGEAQMNVQGIADAHSGRNHLTLRGRAQAEKTIYALKRKGVIPDIIVSSDVLRARETAEIAASILSIKKVIIDPRIREVNVGIFEGGPVRGYSDYYSSRIEKFVKRPPEGENLADLRKRVIECIEETEKKYSGKTILFVSHEYPIWMLYGGSRGLSDEETIALRKGKQEKDFIGLAGVVDIEFAHLPRDDQRAVNLHRPYIDGVVFGCRKCGGRMIRVKELADVWFDSGAMPFAQNHFPFENYFVRRNSKFQILLRSRAQDRGANSKFKKLSYPADYISEAIDQTRGWFYTLLAVGTCLGCRAPYKNVICLGHVLDKNGEKMSKSKGNVVDPWQMIEKYGADVIRWYFYSVNSPGEPKRFDEGDLTKTLRRFFLTCLNVCIFYDTYADKSADVFRVPITNPLDRWILSRLHQTIDWVAVNMDVYEIGKPIKLIEEFVDDLSRWYLRRSRRRLQKPDNRSDFLAASFTLSNVLYYLSVMVAPFAPFFSEMIYQELVKVCTPVSPKRVKKQSRSTSYKLPTSVHLVDWPKPRKSLIDKKLLSQMEEIRVIAAEALGLRSKAGIKVRQPLAQIQIPSASWRTKFQKLQKSQALLNILKDEINVKDVTIGKELKLDTVITPELKEEGIIRDLIRMTQELRQDAKFKPKDRIFVWFKAEHNLRAIIGNRQREYTKEVGARRVEFTWPEKFDAEKEIRIDGQKIDVRIRKA